MKASVIDLSGEWTLSGAGENGEPVSVPAAVPGDVHGALLRAGAIPDPFFGRNEARVQWVGFRDWTLRRAFDVPPEFLARDEIVLRAEDVDCFAELSINGRLVGGTRDRFLRWQFDAKPFLRTGRNEIEAVFRSAAERGDELAAEYAGSHSDRPRLCRFEHEWAHNHVFVRKPACHKGWDWGLSQMTTGFCGPLELVASDHRPIKVTLILK